uniref:Uncharacterized protein n=1 Tax=Orbilia brochopaga TaxID=3140254 RepID=A0A481ZLD8_9PEZI|nr:hypothetical protein [Drechslerella brochopaga]QBL02551.1 hypothetical protein [Drechslerella brochopaga]
MIQASKIIGTGLATTGLIGAGVNETCSPCMKIQGNKLTLNGENPENKDNTVDKKYSETFFSMITQDFFEGDGAIMCFVDKANGYKFKFRIRVIIKLCQKSKSSAFWRN